MKKLSKLVRNQVDIENSICDELAKEVIKAVQNKDHKSMLQIVGALSGRNIASDKLLISIRDELEKNHV
ncbi:hypothetical protein A1QO_00760 [Vibrio genomosp. F10 str. ZF-129]|uniref:Glutamyl-tRNA amidotransferase n=1 Tax=Vibrio genomosp. F10 str. ZF-129 TaxID=1187848 RepID=A0A1E5BGB7_9VIBR|nr:hypothetical protein [Vibrio genomosp. F10]OEE35323.1 hypothetical protein A1QO_00760 [Vibrio genomosp. F10 str. ZF-129]